MLHCSLPAGSQYICKQQRAAVIYTTVQCMADFIIYNNDSSSSSSSDDDDGDGDDDDDDDDDAIGCLITQCRIAVSDFILRWRHHDKWSA